MPLFSRSFLLALALSAPAVAGVAGPASAQTKTAGPTAATAPALPPSAPLITSGLRGEQFILGPDDVISLSVANHPDMSSDGLTLSSTGRVALPVLGPLTLKGKTLEQARVAITNAYKSQLRDPKVSITLVRARPRQATVLGAVTRPGGVDLQPGWRVSEVLASAGGLNALAPDEVKATLKRLSGSPIALDIATIYRAPENKANPRVAVGDVISIVPIPLVNVTINGDVGAPGPQSSRKSPRLLDALGKAGDLKLSPEDTEISLLREGKIIPLDVAGASANPAGANNIELRDGDLLSVQGVRVNVNVISDAALVKAPGLYQLEGRSSFMRAVSAAGGLVGSADNVSASVRRGNQVIPIDTRRAMLYPDADVDLQSGDIVFINPVEGPRVQLTGEIKNPKLYNLKKGARILDAVLEAGGLNIPPETTRISILRTFPDGRQLPLQVDAGRLWRGNDLSQNVELKDGDVVLVNSAAIRSVAVLGKVEKPGTYELKGNDGLTEVLLNAGGPNQLAALDRVTILNRENVVRTVDYSNFGDGQVPKVALEDGDQVQVPVNPNQVLLIGAVLTPGPYAIPQGKTLTLNEAIISAGSTLPGARTSDITLLRRVPKTPKDPQGYITKRVKYGQSNAKLDQSIYLPLEAGDVILVPEGKNGPSILQRGMTALGAFNLVRGFGF